MGVFSSILESRMLKQEGLLMASSFRVVMRQVRWCEAPLAAGLLCMYRYDAGRVVQLLRHCTAGSDLNVHTRRGTQRGWSEGRGPRGRGGARGRGARRRAPSRSLLPPHASEPEPHDPVPSPDPNHYINVRPPSQYPPQHQPQYPPQHLPQYSPQHLPQYPPQNLPQYPPQHLPQNPHPTTRPPQQRPVSPFQGRDMFCNPPNFS
ncbi:hypothetical protein J6590_065180 [Homalodisca vitripennis]|nr:hypothetical protein J6590_065180 [Homalodisca vitripennis]